MLAGDNGKVFKVAERAANAIINQLPEHQTEAPSRKP